MPLGLVGAPPPHHNSLRPGTRQRAPERIYGRAIESRQRRVVLPMSWDLTCHSSQGQKAGDASRRRTYIFRLPKPEYNSKEWQTATHCLIEAADNDGRFSLPGLA